MKKNKRKKSSWILQLLIVISVLSAIIFSAETIILAVGMIPTLVALIVDRSEHKIRAASIGMLNFAGCMPFMVEVFNKGNNIETAVSYVLQPRTIVVIYFAAGMAYMINWMMVGLLSSILVQKTKKRVKEIGTLKAELVERWGVEVTGAIPLDNYGFPLPDHAEKSESKVSS